MNSQMTVIFNLLVLGTPFFVKIFFISGFDG